VAWEHELGHHDPLTDVFSLGLILASLCCGLDLSNPADLTAFVENRGNLFALSAALHPVLAKAIVRMTELERRRRPQDLPSLLDQIRNEARRDETEFGFAQLRLVLCFLRWANLKEKPPERFDSPLVLLPVRLTKTKGVRDVYHLEPVTTEAEINPILRYY